MKSNPIITFLQGIAIGVAEIIPGVSGSTIALLFGVYDDFIDLLYSGSEVARVGLLFLVRKATWAEVWQKITAIRWQFGILLGVGMLGAVVVLSSVIDELLVLYPSYLFAFLLGLLPPTIWIVYQQLTKATKQEMILTGGTAAIFLGIFVLGSDAINVANPHPLHLFIGGLVAVSTMVLPGVSGSFMLLVLGLYNFVVGLVADVSGGNFDSYQLIQLGSLVAGMAVGFLTVVRLLKKAFADYRNELMSFLLGLLFSSWYVLWPFVQVVGFDAGHPIMEKVWPWELAGGHSLALVVIFAATAVVTLKLHQWADRHDPASPKTDQGISKI